MEPLERDEGTYGYVAQRILEGEIPYRDVFDHKPPVVYYIYAAIVKFFGPSVAALRTFTAIYSLFTTLAIFGVGFLIFGQSGALLSAFLYALFSGGPIIQGTSSNTETFMVLPLVLALYCFLRGCSTPNARNWRWLFFAGLFSGLAAMIKPVALFNFLILVIFAFFLKFLRSPITDHRSPITGHRLPITDYRSTLVLILGSLLIPVFFTLYFWSQGALSDFLFCNLIVNQHYLKTSPVPYFLSDPRFGLFRIWQQVTTENGIIWLFSLLSLIFIFAKDRQAKLLLLAWWGIFSFLGVSAGKLFFGHYFIQVIPALSLLSAYSLDKLSQVKNLSIKVLGALVLIAMLIINLPHQIPFYTRFNPYQISEAKYGWKTFGIAYAASQQIAKILKPGDEIFVWAAEPEVYFYLKKKAPSKYPYYLLWMRGIVDSNQILPPKNKLPRFVIFGDYHPLFLNLVNLVKNNYNVKEEFFGWTLYEKKP
ncbi:MAG: glycosyltransferase family 39 protein [Candidatus Margulisiibacteriota bacterium]